jgi:hypothetical protein
MDPTPHRSLNLLFAQSRKAAEQAPVNWIAAFMEALYDLQRHQALGMIRAYEHFLGPHDATEPVQSAGEDADDTPRQRD